MNGSPAPAEAFTLRAMRPSDVAAVMPVERALFDREAWTVAMFRSELAERDSRYYLVAEAGGEVVGYAGLCVYPDEAYVQTIAVREDRWGAGLGSTLLQALLDEAQRRGREVVGLEVRADNERAQELYRRFGFEAVAIRRRYYQPSDVDAVVMQRRTGAPS